MDPKGQRRGTARGFGASPAGRLSAAHAIARTPHFPSTLFSGQRGGGGCLMLAELLALARCFLRHLCARAVYALASGRAPPCPVAGGLVHVRISVGA
jgi:hypothetical protein